MPTKSAAAAKTAKPVYKPLSGFRVLDLSDLQGAYCTKVLGDLGADVVKLEPPEGDPARRIGPFAQDIPDLERSLTFAYYNTNKRGITLDLRSVDGKRLFSSLVKRFDALVESYPPGYLDSLGLGYSRLKRSNKGLVMTSITPFGQDGPRRDYQGTELTLLATGGITYLCGEPESPPCTAPAYKAYDLAGTYAASGVLIALYHRNFSGQGQYQDVSIAESVASTADWVVARQDYEGVYHKRNGATAVTYWPSGLYKTKDDGYVMLFALSVGQFRAFAKWTGKDELMDPMWDDRETRIANIDLLKVLFQEFVGQFTKKEFVDEAQRREVPATPLNDVGEFQRDEHEIVRGFLRQTKHPVFGSYSYPGLPFVLPEWEKPAVSPAPTLGQHNVAVYCQEVGLSKEALISLRSSGVI